jgi:hypothetical protein
VRRHFFHGSSAPVCVSLILLFAALAGCGGTGGTNNPPANSGGSSATGSLAISPSSATITTGATQQFTVTINGTTDKSASWDVDGVQSGNATVGTITSAGLYTAPTTPGTHRIGVTSMADSAKGAHATVTVIAPPTISVAVTPATVTVAGDSTVQFKADVSGVANTAVNWLVDGIAAGNVSSGTITTVGLYTAPAAPGTHRVSAISVAEPAAMGSATVVVTSAIAVTVSPSSVSLAASAQQQFTAIVTGTANATVAWFVDGIAGGQSTTGSITASGLYSAPSTSGTHTVKAISTADPTKSGTAAVTVTAPTEVTVAVKPRTVSLTFTQTQQYTATVAGASNTSVNWLVDGVAGGNSTVGTISSSGIYTPTAGIGKHTITAVSSADTTKAAAATAVISNFAGTFTYQNDNARTGKNLNERLLTPALVNASQFGKILSYQLDGFSLAQPLYVANLSIPGKGTHNVIYVATEHDSVYAFDADGKISGPIWKASFINPSAGVTSVPGADVGKGSLYPEIGITATPVIDPVTATLYAVAMTKEGSGYVHRLHALDLATGAERSGSPVRITATISGNGTGSVSGQLTFNSQLQLNRPGLLLINGTVYVAFGSYQDVGAYHGWLFAYDAQSLQQKAVWNSSPNGSQGAIWQSGCGLSADSSGNLFFTVANGSFTAASGGSGFGNSIIRMSLVNGSAAVLDYFAPFNQDDLNAQDFDLGTGCALLLPDQGSSSHPHLVLTGGKAGDFFLVDRDNMGHQHPADNSQAVQVLSVGKAFSSAAYWNNLVYIGVNAHPVQALSLTNGLLSTTASQTAHTFGYPGVTPVISSMGTSDGILWVIERLDTTNAVMLRAYDATDLSRELYNSAQAGDRDTIGAGTRFAIPLVANGKVYVATATQVVVFGALP